MGRFFERCFGGRFEVIFYFEYGWSDVGLLEEFYLKLDVIMVVLFFDIVLKRLERFVEILREYGGKKIVFDIVIFKFCVVEVYVGFGEEIRVVSVYLMFGFGVKIIEGKRFIMVFILGREKDVEEVVDFICFIGGNVFFFDWKIYDRFMGFVIGVFYFIGLSYFLFFREFGLEEFGGIFWVFLEIYGKVVFYDFFDFIREVFSMFRE